jgi:hypothetical protein
MDAVRFPAFAELARGADWYRNATTVHESTTYAVPAILTGRYPRPHRVPTAAPYPQNLFTLLSGAYRLNVFENQTHLCPRRTCRGSSAGSFGGQLESLASDASVVYLHLVLPKRLTRGLPSISESWDHFLGHSDDEPARFRRFLSSLHPSSRPELWFVHLLLPHSPWQYLPDGSRYRTSYPVPPWESTEFWTKDAAIVLQNRQRYLLQTAYVDTLLGDLLRRLRRIGLYDRSLVIVTPDHGIGFRPGHKRRPVWPGNLHEIAFVPFFVKHPHQRIGRVIDTHVETVDVMPTIAEAAGVRGVRFDGRVLGSGGPARRVVVRKSSGAEVSSPLAPLLRRRWAALRAQLEVFGSETPANALYGLGRYRGLLGRRPAPATPAARRAHVLLADAARYRAVDLDPLEAAVQLHGRITGAHLTDVAIAIDGRIAAVVPVFEREFWALAPRSAFRAGANAVRVYAVSGRVSAPRLRTLLP